MQSLYLIKTQALPMCLKINFKFIKNLILIIVMNFIRRKAFHFTFALKIFVRFYVNSKFRMHVLNL
jgi:hypothetical protein